MYILTAIFKHGLIQCEQLFMLYLFLLVKKMKDFLLCLMNKSFATLGSPFGKENLESMLIITEIV